MKRTARLLLFCVLVNMNGFSQVVSATWETFNMTNSPMPDNTVRCLLVDNMNTLWIGTDNGLAHLSHDSWEIFNEANSGLSDNYVRALAVDQNNAIWVGSTLGGIQKFDGSTWTNFNTNTSGIPDNFIKTISIDLHGNKWVGTAEGLSWFNDTTWTTWTTANSPLLTNNISSVGIGEQNEKYIGTINGGLVYMDADTNFTGIWYILNSGVPDNSALKVQIDSLGKPWYAGSAGGLWTDTGNQTWMAFNYANSPMPTNSLTNMYLDDLNNFYLATQQNGLVIKRYNQSWTNYTPGNSDLAENYILSVAKDANGDVWLGTFSKGLVKLKEEFLGLSEAGAMGQLKAYPNPVESGGIVHFNGVLNNARITVLTTDAKIISDQVFEGDISLIELPELESGTYLIRVAEKSGSAVVRVMVL
jgi:ligand-binding sensor domain-containing protein